MMPRRRCHLLAACLIVAAAAAPACKPDLGSPTSLVVGPRILAVRGAPPEVAAAADVTFDALAVDPAGTIAAPSLRWSFCHQPKPPAEANAVSIDCLKAPDDAGPAPTFMTTMPSGAQDPCQLFGPQTPPVQPGQLPIRPRDPDVTGGFYQPLRVVLDADGGSDTAFELERVTCPLANAPIDATRVFNTTYTPNQNPLIGQVTADPAGVAAVLFMPGAPPPAAPASVVPGLKVTFEVSWADASAESFPVWDVASRMLVTHRESLRVSWFATAGAFARDTTGRAEDELETFSDNDWTAPSDAGTVHFGVVLRDSRGGVDFGAFDVLVSP